MHPSVVVCEWVDWFVLPTTNNTLPHSQRDLLIVRVTQARTHKRVLGGRIEVASLELAILVDHGKQCAPSFRQIPL
jgi:hypothetical protein